MKKKLSDRINKSQFDRKEKGKSMKSYVVYMGNLPLAPLQGHNPRGVRSQEFGELAEARSFAVGIKDEWNFVTTYKRTKEGKLEKIEQYEKGHFFTSDKHGTK